MLHRDLKAFLVKVLAGLGLFLVLYSPVLYFNLAMDPFGIFREDWGEQRIVPNKHYRKLQYLLEGDHAYDGFLFGSSRPNNIDCHKIPGMDIYNLSYSEGLPSEHLRDLKLLHRQGVQFNTVLVALDFSSYMVDPQLHWSQGLRMPYPETAGEHHRFVTNYILTPPPEWSFVRDLLNSPRTDRYRDVVSEGRSYNTEGEAAIRSDAEAHRNHPKFDHAHLEAHYKARIPETLAEIRGLVAFCDSLDIALTLFINPIHHTTYRAIDHAAYAGFLRELASIHPFHDFCQIHPVTTDNMNYYETSHYRPQVGDRIVERLFAPDTLTADATAWGALITPENVEKRLEFLAGQLRP
ncbi:MAG: hypothetical protein AAGB22_00555 [Bacteroidota bacterium]